MLAECAWAGFWGWDGWTAVEALAVIAALVIGFLTVRSQITATNLLVRQYANDDETRQRSQANAVVLYATSPIVENSLLVHHDVTLINKSDKPVTGVDIWVIERDPAAAKHLAFVEVIGPGEEVPWVMLPEEHGIGRDQSAELRVRFTDAAGRIWRKNGIGELWPDDPNEPRPESLPDNEIGLFNRG